MLMMTQYLLQLTLHSHLQEDMTDDEEVEEAEYAAPSKGKKKPRLRKGTPDKKTVQKMLDALGVHAQHKSDADFTEHCAHCSGTGEAGQKCCNGVKQSNRESFLQLCVA